MVEMCVNEALISVVCRALIGPSFFTPAVAYSINKPFWTAQYFFFAKHTHVKPNLRAKLKVDTVGI